MDQKLTRRESFAVAAGAVAAAGGIQVKASTRNDGNAIVVDPSPKHDLSPYLYMQFTEPLGATDGSVEAAWDRIEPGGHCRVRRILPIGRRRAVDVCQFRIGRS